jgi:mevalonate kinase
MPAFSATAPGKIILFGEHAVVYGRPAIAVPIEQLRARAVISADPHAEPGTVHIQAPDIDLDTFMDQLPANHPLRKVVQVVLTELAITRPPALKLRVSSTIPLAAGLGSGAAVSVAIIRALSAFLGHRLQNDKVSSLAYEVEKLHHGTPSGIDNTVVTYSMPVFFVRGSPLETFRVESPFTLVIGDTGISSPTAIAVGDLRRAWLADPEHYEPIFDDVAQIVASARSLIESGQVRQLGPLMNENQVLLQEMGVSCVELDRLVSAACMAGALGAKLSGGGRGGNMIALVEDSLQADVVQALESAGAARTFTTQVGGSGYRTVSAE